MFSLACVTPQSAGDSTCAIATWMMLTAISVAGFAVFEFLLMGAQTTAPPNPAQIQAAKDAVSLNARFAVMNDVTTTYTDGITLDATSQKNQGFFVLKHQVVGA